MRLRVPAVPNYLSISLLSALLLPCLLACGPKNKAKLDTSCAHQAVQTQGCGFNDRGTEERTCIEGEWGDWAECQPPQSYMSCLEILEFNPDAEDGEYPIAPYGTAEILVSCDMTTEGGGWTLIADYDFAEDPCLGQWAQQDGGACRRPKKKPASAYLEPLGVYWSEAHFRMGIGPSKTNDAFGWRDRSEWNAEESYVDGVSLTTGEPGSRKHLFTYAFGSPGTNEGTVVCPDLGGAEPQLFVAEAYICDAAPSGSDSSPLFTQNWYIAKASGSRPIASAIEVRLMGDEGANNENTFIYYLTVFIR